jgi:hypothetical protein
VIDFKPDAGALSHAASDLVEHRNRIHVRPRRDAMKLRCHVPVVRSGGLISVALVPAISVLPTASAIRLRPLLGVLDVLLAPLPVRATAPLGVALRASTIHILAAATVATIRYAVCLESNYLDSAACALACIDQPSSGLPLFVALGVFLLAQLFLVAFAATVNFRV